MNYNDYENYSNTSKNYDSNRTAHGIDIILGNILLLNKTKLKILDVGCGTGNFLYELYNTISKNSGLKNLISEYHCIEPNEGMLDIAKNKFKIMKTKKCIAENIDYEDSSFDVILCTQVLHHLIDNRYKRVNKAVKEMNRVLRKDGIIIINNMSREQTKSYWYLHLFGDSLKKIKSNLINNSTIINILVKKGFDNPRLLFDSSIIFKNNYYNEELPLHEKFRFTDSVWSLLNNNELNTIINNVKDMIKKKEMKEFIKRKDNLRIKYGQSTFIIAKKI